MNIEEIKEQAQEKIDKRESSKAVEMYMSLLALKKEAQKQLNILEEKIKRFEEDPNKFIEKNEELWV